MVKTSREAFQGRRIHLFSVHSDSYSSACGPSNVICEFEVTFGVINGCRENTESRRQQFGEGFVLKYFHQGAPHMTGAGGHLYVVQKRVEKGEANDGNGLDIPLLPGEGSNPFSAEVCIGLKDVLALTV